jgi:catechol 2,3-dioxygenase-like lactoylglutathione lyase family enzyme
MLAHRPSFPGQPIMQPTFDRAAEDLGNSIHLEHVNVRVPDQRLATLFYAAGLGLTRDPVMMVGDGNMWINVGRSQFHLPTGKPQVLRGHTGLVIAGRAALIERLAAVRERLKETRFGFSEQNDYVEATCPWGNRVRCYEPDPARFGPINLGIPYVEFDVPVGTTQAIADFYRRMIDVPARVERNGGDGAVARVMVGRDQDLLFRETDRPLPEFDNHHVAIYLVNFSGPYRKLRERNLVSQEDNRYQYRFRDIVEPDGGRHLFTVEHEVRSVTHPMYLRPLVNRNPIMTNQNYAAGHEQTPWAIDPEQYDGRTAVRPS